MYTTHFGLKRQAFLERVPPEEIIQDERMAEGLARLNYLAEAGTLGVLVGQTGVGKSCLLKLLFHNLSRNRYRALYLHLTGVNSVGLLKLIVRGLGEIPRRGKETLFMQILEATRKAEGQVILVIDEAHLLEPASLIDLRLLMSSALRQQPPLKLILAGQEALGAILRRSRHADLLNRVSVRYHLRPFDRNGTVTYIDKQLSKAGGTARVFESEAKDLIHDWTGGVPRQINNVATACLLNAASRNLKKVSGKLVNDTMAEFQLP